MEFGVFDHLDRAGTLLSDYFEDRLKIVYLLRYAWQMIVIGFASP